MLDCVNGGFSILDIITHKRGIARTAEKHHQKRGLDTRHYVTSSSAAYREVCSIYYTKNTPDPLAKAQDRVIITSNWLITNGMDLLKNIKKEETKIDLVELYKIQVEKCPFSVGQIVWKMHDNEPTEFIILSIGFTLYVLTKHFQVRRTKPIIQMVYTARCLSETFMGQDFDGCYARREDLTHSL